jgi:hypothetical protein
VQAVYRPCSRTDSFRAVKRLQFGSWTFVGGRPVNRRKIFRSAFERYVQASKQGQHLECVNMTTKKISYFVALLTIGLVLVACERLKIGDINADPSRYMNKEVTVAGEVTQSIGALGRGVYQVDDGTGKLWVFSDSRGVPSKGAKVGVKGHIIPTFTFLGVNYATVMQESDRRRG